MHRLLIHTVEVLFLLLSCYQAAGERNSRVSELVTRQILFTCEEGTHTASIHNIVTDGKHNSAGISYITISLEQVSQCSVIVH